MKGVIDLIAIFHKSSWRHAPTLRDIHLNFLCSQSNITKTILYNFNSLVAGHFTSDGSSQRKLFQLPRYLIIFSSRTMVPRHDHTSKRRNVQYLIAAIEFFLMSPDWSRSMKSHRGGIPLVFRGSNTTYLFAI